MRRMTMLAAVAVAILSLSAPFVFATDGEATAAKPVTNKVCPLMGDEVEAKWRLEHDGQYVYFCCRGCIDMFKADPAAAIAKMSEEDKAAIMKNTKCAVSGEEITSFDVRSEQNGRFVYFCCGGCKTKFDKEHTAAK
jgi:YHS domain-containing protein